MIYNAELWAEVYHMTLFAYKIQPSNVGKTVLCPVSWQN